MIVLAVALPSFRSPGNLQGIISQVAVTGVVALAVNQVILAGEIDISTGSLLGLTAAVAGAVAERSGGVLLPLAAAIGVGLVVGAVNGLLSTAARLPSIIVTLGMMNIIRGQFLDRAGGLVFNPPAGSQFLGSGAMPIIVLFLAALAFGLVNIHSTWGRNVFAVGGNSRAALLAGLSPRRTRFWSFVVAGGCVGLASMIYLGQVGQVQATAGTGFELQVIAAVVVGGTSVAGGRGSTAAPLVGAILIGVILNALTLTGVAGTWQDFVLGALILMAISADALRRRILR
ncbi:ABC transporter permease [Actinomadura sp. WMMA1423]|uniref:ABC transporter permease n=1 Tax=Actinomadura sp. WMMA1423 TaxID=2591108 RepID=UPI00143D964E|nr:ABC transporter permease [Actinomadura sp. WMMA1423]